MHHLVYYILSVVDPGHYFGGGTKIFEIDRFFFSIFCSCSHSNMKRGNWKIFKLMTFFAFTSTDSMKNAIYQFFLFWEGEIPLFRIRHSIKLRLIISILQFSFPHIYSKTSIGCRWSWLFRMKTDFNFWHLRDLLKSSAFNLHSSGNKTVESRKSRLARSTTVP